MNKNFREEVAPRARGARAHKHHAHNTNKMVQASRIFLRRVPSITFPVRMIDGVRVTGAVSSTLSSSPGKNVKDGFALTKKKASSSSSSSSSSKAPPVVISEEECEIVNVSFSRSLFLSVVVVVAFSLSLYLSLYSLLLLLLLPGIEIPLKNALVFFFSFSLSLTNAHQRFILSLSLSLAPSLRRCDTDGRIPARFGREPRRQRAVYDS